MTAFSVTYDDIWARAEAVDPEAYTNSRNFLSGAVTRLSPFFSRGVISGRQMLESLVSRGLKRYSCEKLVQELAWREYFQRVWQERPDLAEIPLKQPQIQVRSGEIPRSLVEASTGIDAVDAGIEMLYETGYMHNHLRMYTAFLACNAARCSWVNAGRWMYYHLLDADPASNFCSWQWICGAFSSKRYAANQENINRYCGTNQRGGFLDKTYEELEQMEVPEVLKETAMPEFVTSLPHTAMPVLDQDKPLLVYNFFNLDPQWRMYEDCNRVLLLEPSLFSRFPVSGKVIDFTLALARQIKNLQIFCGEFDELISVCKNEKLIFREHPLSAHYRGVQEERDWMFPQVKGYFPSFSAYWKKCLPHYNAYFA